MTEATRRGIQISLTERSWSLIIDLLRWMATEAEEPPEGQCSRLADYIESQLKK